MSSFGSELKSGIFRIPFLEIRENKIRRLGRRVISCVEYVAQVRSFEFPSLVVTHEPEVPSPHTFPKLGDRCIKTVPEVWECCGFKLRT